MAQALAVVAATIAGRGGEMAESVSRVPGRANYMGGRTPEIQRGGIRLRGSQYLDKQPGGESTLPPGWKET